MKMKFGVHIKKKIIFILLVAALLTKADGLTFTFSMLGKNVSRRHFKIKSTLAISKSKRLSEILRDIRTSIYQICRIEKNISHDHI